MSKSFFGVIGGFQADSNERVSTVGKDGLIMEVVEVAASAGGIILYKADYTTYIKVPPLATTGAAVLKDIKHINAVCSGFCVETDPNDMTTTLNEASELTSVEYINGPTTLAIVGTHKNNDDVIFRLVVFGKSF